MKSTFDISDGLVVEAPEDRACIFVFAAPSEAERRDLVERFGLDPYDIDSALDPDEAARIELGRDRLTLIWKRAKSATVDEQFRLDVSSLGLFLLQGRLVLILDENLALFRSKEFQGVHSASDVLLRLLLHSIRHYVAHLKVIKQLSTSLEKKISASMENRYLLQMFILGENLVYYLDAIEANGAVLTRFRGAADKLGLQREQTELLDDIVLDNQQAARQANIYSNVMSGLMDARGTIVNNNMNVLLKNLTIINIVFLPLNLIAGILGMSEYSMMTNGMNWKYSYFAFTLTMIVMGWVTWILVVRGIERRPMGRKA